MFAGRKRTIRSRGHQWRAWRQIEAEAKELMAQATNIVVTPMTGRFEDRLDGYEDVFDPLEFKTALVPLTPPVEP